MKINILLFMNGGFSQRRKDGMFLGELGALAGYIFYWLGEIFPTKTQGTKPESILVSLVP